MSVRERFFYVIYIKEPFLKTIVNGIRLFADPTQKYEAHITVRGPYEPQKPADKFLKLWSKKIQGELIEVNGVGSFFDTNQNTVFFKCAYSDALKDIWMKKDYGGFTPHITIYDKGDSIFAHRLFSELDDLNIEFSFDVQSFDILVSEKRTLWEGKTRLIDKIDYSILSECMNQKMSNELITGSGKEVRLDYIRHLALLLNNKVLIK